MSRFIEYQLRIDGKHDTDITDEVINKFKQMEQQHPEYGFNGVGTTDNDEAGVFGTIVAKSKSECNQILTDLKSSLRDIFSTKKISSLFVAHGEC